MQSLHFEAKLSESNELTPPSQIGEFNPVSLEDDYRKSAAETLDLAQRAPTAEDKARLLGLATAWLNLADRAHRTASHVRKLRELNPLLRS